MLQTIWTCRRRRKPNGFLAIQRVLQTQTMILVYIRNDFQCTEARIVKEALCMALDAFCDWSRFLICLWCLPSKEILSSRARLLQNKNMSSLRSCRMRILSKVCETVIVLVQVKDREYDACVYTKLIVKCYLKASCVVLPVEIPMDVAYLVIEASTTSLLHVGEALTAVNVFLSATSVTKGNGAISRRPLREFGSWKHW